MLSRTISFLQYVFGFSYLGVKTVHGVSKKGIQLLYDRLVVILPFLSQTQQLGWSKNLSNGVETIYDKAMDQFILHLIHEPNQNGIIERRILLMSDQEDALPIIEKKLINASKQRPGKVLNILSEFHFKQQDYQKAYEVAKNHSLIDGPEFAEAEWMSGWISLSFLNDPNSALRHFKNFYENVGYPISLARGAYWIGLTYEKLGNDQLSKKFYQEGSKYLTCLLYTSPSPRDS